MFPSLCYAQSHLYYPQAYIDVFRGLTSEADAKIAENRDFWINTGLGFSPNGVAAGLSLSLQPPKPGYLLFSVRGIVTAEILGDDFGDVAVLVGYSSKRPQSRGYFSIATGISRVSGPPIESTFGIPVDVQLFYTLTSYAGIGLQGFADFNKEQNLYGVLLCMQFGTLQ